MSLPAPEWGDIRHWLRKHYPDVNHLEVDELAAWLRDAKRPRPLLVDIRAAGEQAVSWIDGACFAHSEGDAMQKLEGQPPHTPIIAYCAVGVRSASLARALCKSGFTNVHNVEGSIFAWANRGLPLSGPAGPATKVHPYDEHWGVLLDPERRSEIPSRA